MGKKKFNDQRNNSNPEGNAGKDQNKTPPLKVIKDIGDTEQAKKNAKILEEKTKYDRYHHNILWIDDMDNKDAGAEDEICKKIKWMQTYLETEKDAYYINLVDKLSEAIHEIENNCNQYDLVVFDFNLSECDDILDNEIFKKYNLNFSGDNSLRYGGLYLYLLLLSVGYPINRMVFYSANMSFITDTDNSDNEIQKIIKTLFTFKDTKYLQTKSSSEKLKIEQYFTDDDNSYYRIRRLVFQACEFWKEHDILNDEKENEVPFNNLYKLDIQKSGFREMLDHIEMLFPVKEPAEVKKVYFQAAKTLCMFHEESAHIQDLDNKKSKRYHQVARYFRNWSAHNKFGTLKMSPEMFALLFCITLRTYFDNAQISDSFSELYDYEKLYYSDNIEVNEVVLKNILDKWSIVLDTEDKYIKEILAKSVTQKSLKGLVDKLNNVDAVLRTYGETSTKKIPMDYLLHGTVFSTDKILAKYDLTYELKLSGDSIIFNRNQQNSIAFSIKEENQSSADNNSICTNLEKDIFSENGSDFERLVFRNAYKILTAQLQAADEN